MTDSKLLNSSVWLAYFYAENNEIKSIVESSIILLTSSISLFEVKNKLIRDKTEDIKAQNSINFINPIQLCSYNSLHYLISFFCNLQRNL